MLDMFKRPTDPPEYNYRYLIPGTVFTGGFLLSALNGLSHVNQMAYLGKGIDPLNHFCPNLVLIA